MAKKFLAIFFALSLLVSTFSLAIPVFADGGPLRPQAIVPNQGIELWFYWGANSGNPTLIGVRTTRAIVVTGQVFQDKVGTPFSVPVSPSESWSLWQLPGSFNAIEANIAGVGNFKTNWTCSDEVAYQVHLDTSRWMQFHNLGSNRLMPVTSTNMAWPWIESRETAGLLFGAEKDVSFFTSKGVNCGSFTLN